MKKLIKNYLLFFDAFGDIPIVSLQHPKKGTDDCFMCPLDSKPKFMNLINQFQDLFGDFLIAFTGEVEYEPGKEPDDYRTITSLKVDQITLINNLEEGQPNNFGQ